MKAVRIFAILIITLCSAAFSIPNMTVRDALLKVKYLFVPDNGQPVDWTVAGCMKELAKAAQIEQGKRAGKSGVFHVGILGENGIPGVKDLGINPPQDRDWTFLKLDNQGNGFLIGSKQHLLYSLYCSLRDDWLDKDVQELAKGTLSMTTFPWIEGSDGAWPSHANPPRHYDPEKSIQELARLGCSHIVVNGLAGIAAYEQGPPGEIYYRFYYGNTDLDYFTDSELNKGIYPPEFLQANMNFMKANAKLAVKYGLTPGLFFCTPRSVQDALLDRYPFLRGARIDHTFRCFNPRYTLTLAHPVVRWHYAEMMKKLMTEIPELAYMGWRTNDAGAGFEYTVTTYPGRNGGPYLIREWKSHEEVAKAAAANVVRYIKLLRDAASEIRPDFRIISSLASFPEEGKFILPELGDRLDLSVSLADTADPMLWQNQKALLNKNGYLHSGIGMTSQYIMGVPFPWLTHDNLRKYVVHDLTRLSVGTQSICLAPYDINRQIFHAFQKNANLNIDETVNALATKWVGTEQAARLVRVWKSMDNIVRTFPTVPLYEGYGFYTLRIWIRPFVPDIGKIPSAERDYYEKYLNSIFNNPTLVDFSKDALWNLVPAELAEKIVAECDGKIWAPLDKTIADLQEGIKTVKSDHPAYAVFVDQRDRLIGLKCYYRTLRNLAAWVVGVHGYLDAVDPAVKESKHRIVKAMMDDEIANIKTLIKLYKESHTDFMAISDISEDLYSYCSVNFTQWLEKKIKLMEAHKNDAPYIDPNFMWQMPASFPVSPQVYLKY